MAGMTAVAGSLALGRSALGSMDEPGSPAALAGKLDDFVAGKPDKLAPFPMTQVRLLDGIFKAQAEINQKYLDSLTTDRLLHSFHMTSGITSNATPYGGWERPDCTLRGHFNGGHYLSAVALAYASAGNETLRARGDAIVAELARCQKANGNGYLSAYPAEQFALLAAGVTEYPRVWAPFYTQHKIMAGLVDMYVHTGNEQALAGGRRNGGVGERILTQHWRRPAAEDAAHRVWRDERGAGKPVRVDRQAGVSGYGATVRTACISRMHWLAIATS